MGSQVETIVARIKEVAVLPQVVHQVMELSLSPTASASDLERVISVDPGMSSRVLNIVNSAYYGLPRKIASVKEAVIFLGFKAIRHIAMSAGVFEMFVGKADHQNLRRRAWWCHSLDTALCARLIGSQLPNSVPGETYTAGLLHDIGKPLLDRYGGCSYDEVEKLIQQGVPPLEAERAVYGCDHAELGHAVSLHWRFPENLAQAIGCHHQDFSEELEDPQLTAVTSLANYLAHQIRLQEQGETPDLSMPTWTLGVLGLDQASLQTLQLACEVELSQSPLLAFAS